MLQIGQHAPKVSRAKRVDTRFGVQAKCCFIGITKHRFIGLMKHTPLAKSVGGVHNMTNEASEAEPGINCEVSQVEPRLMKC
jgi:hypothetical protein